MLSVISTALAAVFLGALGISLALLTLAGSVSDFFGLVNLLIDIVRSF